MGLQEAQAQLEAAEQAASGGGFSVADWELAQHRARLGRVRWALSNQQQALALWLQAAAVEGPAQVLLRTVCACRCFSSSQLQHLFFTSPAMAWQLVFCCRAGAGEGYG